MPHDGIHAYASVPFTADINDQGRLFLDHVGLVYHWARRLLPAHDRVSLTDLLRAGMLGLQQAVDTYDRARIEASFKDHATSYVRNALLYELCAVDHLESDVRATARRISAAEEELAQCLGRTPEEREIAWCLDITPETLATMRTEIELARVASHRRATEQVAIALEEREEEETAPLVVSFQAPESCERKAAILQRALLRLKEQERLVISLLYYEGLSVADTAKVLALSPSVVTELRSRALRSLRRAAAPLQLVMNDHEVVS